MLVKKISRAIEILLTETLVPFYAIFPQFMRNGLVFFAERLYVGTVNSLYYWDVLTRQKIGNTTFKLWIKGGHRTAQKIYRATEKSQETYEPLMFGCLQRALDASKNPVFIDIGAFMGYYACYVSSYLKDKTPVYAVESNPDYCKCITHSIKENNFHNLRLHPGVLSDKEEILSVYKEYVTKDDPRGKKLKSTTLDNICIENNIKPTILKVDVDGSEGKVFLGAKKILRESVDFIILELHPDDYLEKSSAGMKQKDIISILEENRFKNYVIGGFRFKRSPEKKKFDESGKVSYLEITNENKEIIFYDRFVDLFIFSVKNHNITDLLD